MYSLFCESLNKVQMKLMKLQSYTDFAISLFDFGQNDSLDFVCSWSAAIISIGYLNIALSNLITEIWKLRESEELHNPTGLKVNQTFWKKKLNKGKQ